MVHLGPRGYVNLSLSKIVTLTTFRNRDADDFRKYYINLTSLQVYMPIDDAHHKFPEKFSFT